MDQLQEPAASVPATQAVGAEQEEPCNFLTRAEQDLCFPDTAKGNRRREKEAKAKAKTKAAMKGQKEQAQAKGAPKRRGRPPKKQEDAHQEVDEEVSQDEEMEEVAASEKESARRKAKSIAKTSKKKPAAASPALKRKVPEEEDITPPPRTKRAGRSQTPTPPQACEKCPVDQSWKYSMIVAYWSKCAVGLKIRATNQQAVMKHEVMKLPCGNLV